jgi:hypothetical protein
MIRLWLEQLRRDVKGPRPYLHTYLSKAAGNAISDPTWCWNLNQKVVRSKILWTTVSQKLFMSFTVHTGPDRAYRSQLTAARLLRSNTISSFMAQAHPSSLQQNRSRVYAPRGLPTSAIVAARQAAVQATVVPGVTSNLLPLPFSN